MVMENELYEGFTKEQADRYRKEARELYGRETVDETERRIKKMSKAGWDRLKADGGALFQAMAAMMDRDPSDPEVQTVAAKHHAWVERFYPASARVYRGLGETYASHSDFVAFFDKIRPGLACFLRDAMAHYADTVLMKR
jgi:MerR family transcriptional regulator, thiopeptide resistance regulator